MMASTCLAIVGLCCTVVAAGRFAQQHSAGSLQHVALSESVASTANNRAFFKATSTKDMSDEEACQSQVASFDRHVKEFCEQIRPALRNGSYAWLTYISDVRATDMAKSISDALWAGKPDASSGFLFARASFREKGLLLWSGAPVRSRQFWCEELGLYLLHDDVLGDEFRTPFGSLLEMEGVKDSQGRLFGSCEWERAGPLWRSASEAVVRRSSQELAVRVLLKKALVGKEWTLAETAFFQFELVGLARHPPKGGMKILNAHESVKCVHVMPLLRARIEEVGSEKDWKSVQSFSCVDVPELPQKGKARDLDSQAFEFPKPWSDLDPQCKVTNKALTRPLFQDCLSQGHVDWNDLLRLSHQENIVGTSGILQEHGPQVAVVLPDFVRMFPSRMLDDLINLRRSGGSPPGLAAKAATALHSLSKWEIEPDLATLQLFLSVPDDHVRWKAVRHLGLFFRQAIHDPASVLTCLWMAMSDPNLDVRTIVASILASSPDTRLVGPVLETVKKVLSGNAGSVWYGSAAQTKLVLESGIADERAVNTAVTALEYLGDQHFGAVLPVLEQAAASGKLQTRLRIVKAAATLCKKDITRKGDLRPLLQKAAEDVAPAVKLDARSALIFSCADSKSLSQSN